MISWKAVGLGLGTQLLLQVALFFGIPLFGPAALLDWTALLTWASGPFAGGIPCGLVRQGYAWISGLVVGVLGTTLFVSGVLLRGDWWLIGAAIIGGGLIGTGGALIGRGVTKLTHRG